MSVFVVRLPDVGEGMAEAELVSWHVEVGQAVTPDTTVAEVLTDKATVEIYAPVAGTIVALHGQPGDVLAVGSEFVAIETDTPPPSSSSQPPPTPTTAASERVDVRRPTPALGHRIEAAPAVRARASTSDVDLGDIVGSGAGGRVTHEDLDRRAQAHPVAESVQVPIIGLRRKIAHQMTTASSRIPHITYVEEVDMTNVEHLRQSLTKEFPDRDHLTVLPLVMRAVVLAIADHPQLNATFDDETETLTTYTGVHIGVATQTANGLLVPVVRDVQNKDLWLVANELGRVTAAARAGTAVRGDLNGSTITITSLGALGGIATTPIINHPEVAIVGINKMQIRPVWDGASFIARTMMNLSSSFDHRIVDGWQAATFIQRIKTLLEEPSLMFVD